MGMVLFIVSSLLRYRTSLLGSCLTAKLNLSERKEFWLEARTVRKNSLETIRIMDL